MPQNQKARRPRSRLAELHIENLAVIERTTILFGDGLTAVTGESGSGKTMLVNALDLLLGARADIGAVRRGATEARIDARFETQDADGALFETVVSRVIPATGRSRAYLDGRPTTTTALAEVTGGLLDLHGQHEQHRLGSMAWRRALLDIHGGIDTAALDAIREQMVAIEAEIAALGGSGTDRAREVDLLSYQIDEIDSHGIDGPDEDDRLRELIERLGAVDEIRRRGTAALSRLLDDDPMTEALRDLGGLPGLTEVHDRLADLIEERRDLAATLRRALDDVDADPERLDRASQRYAALAELKRKYGENLVEVLGFRDAAAERRDLLSSHDERLAVLAERLSVLGEEHRTECRRVVDERTTAAASLGALITDEVTTLGMDHARIDVTVDGEDGSIVELLFSSGPGDAPRPVQRVASGGEAARCMLAIDLVRSRIDDPGNGPSTSGTVVLDEVDAGLGGVAGGAVAAALRELARTHQVIVVTHLAAVAAAADQQIRVTKGLVAGVATTTVGGLALEDRVEELARMFAGHVDDSAREHARQLLQQASAVRRRGSG